MLSIIETCLYLLLLFIVTSCTGVSWLNHLHQTSFLHGVEKRKQEGKLKMCSDDETRGRAGSVEVVVVVGYF